MPSKAGAKADGRALGFAEPGGLRRRRSCRESAGDSAAPPPSVPFIKRRAFVPSCPIATVTAAWYRRPLVSLIREEGAGGEGGAAGRPGLDPTRPARPAWRTPSVS